MIISASRWIDIPAWYGEWFMNRIRAGFCETANPFNQAQRTRVSLLPEDVSCIVFWTRHACSLEPHLGELERRGYFSYFLYTLLDYPRELEPHSPPLAERINLVKRISDRVGPDRIVWRYDPVVITSKLDKGFHREAFRKLADELKGRSRRVIISLYDPYAKTKQRFSRLPREFRPLQLPVCDTAAKPPPLFDEPQLAFRDRQDRIGGAAAQLKELFGYMKECAEERGMEIHSCAGDLPGITSGACIDPQLINRLTEAGIDGRRDPGQRKGCLCTLSRDIGSYDSCLFGCVYCYACGSREKILERCRHHDPGAEAPY
jgi:hypothetical protein